MSETRSAKRNGGSELNKFDIVPLILTDEKVFVTPVPSQYCGSHELVMEVSALFPLCLTIQNLCQDDEGTLKMNKKGSVIYDLTGTHPIESLIPTSWKDLKKKDLTSTGECSYNLALSQMY
ncbi:hypothetical protein H5410_003541 [Solanum commersonii]|uniref:Uncharacterized protein n=1 Tax=Solanum commersonii TaxID=4109 RepID=A0A9J6B5B6_SOLCO|nr:hypothetical protein H5410_003541 [Solanum commersonii]